MIKQLLISGLLFGFLALANTAHAGDSIKPLKVGNTLPPLTLKTQYGKNVTIGKEAKALLFAVEKAPSALINDFLLKQEVDYLVKNKAYFVADISGMPSMITKMFAIPKMKKHPYDILLAKNAAKVAFIPRKKQFVTVVKIAAGKVTAIMFLNKAEQLAGTLR